MLITLQPISQKGDLGLNRIYTQYAQTFPPEERRNKEQFYDLLKKENASINLILSESDEVGYIILWKLKNTLFIEHFEIYPSYRNQNLGANVLQYLLETYPSIVLETEPSGHSELAEKRINFYKRNGFEIIDTQYIQPAYDKEKDPIPLFLMGSTLEMNLALLKKEIYETVYK